MNLLTKLAIRKHKKSCPFVFRLEVKHYPVRTDYRCEFEHKVIASEKKTTAYQKSLVVGKVTK
jgi:hypothetical protein